jgi:hypothetical protein
MRRASKFLGVAALLAGFGVSSASASIIGVNFVNNGGGFVQDGAVDALTPAEMAGAPGYTQMHWNNLGRWGQNVNAIDGTGAASGALVTWDSAWTWNTGVGAATPNHKLMHGYLDATGQPNDNNTPYSFWDNKNKPEVYVSGLSAWLAAQGATSYNVVVYFDGDATAGRKAEYWLQGSLGGDPPNALGADLTSHVFASDVENFSGTFTQVPLSANSLDNAAAGNYLVFTGLNADNFILRTEEQSFRATISGMQIAVVPEPASLSLLGLGALALLARRRQA